MKISLTIPVLGFISLLLISLSVFLQLDSLEKLSVKSSPEHIKILEKFAIDPNIKFKVRKDSAKEIYFESGRKIDVLQGNGEVILYSPSHEEEISRDKRLRENSRIIKNINDNKLLCKIILAIITISSILAATVIFCRLIKLTSLRKAQK